MTVLNVFNLREYIEEEVSGFDENSIYVVDQSINQIILHVNSIFDWEGLAEKIEKKFPQGDFEFVMVGLDLTINF